MNIFKMQYQVPISEIEKSYSHQLGLKNNAEYEKWADENFIQLVQHFTRTYPTVEIQNPEYRIKSDESILGKEKNLQIERLSKLSAIRGISKEQEEELYKLIEERVYEKPQYNIEQILNTVQMIIKSKNVQAMDIDQIREDIASIDVDIDLGIEQAEEAIIRGSLSASTKTALLRVLVGKLQKSNLTYKNVTLRDLDNLFGEAAAKKTGKEEDNLIRYESIKAIQEDPEKMAELEDAHQFLKAKDLIGMEIIIKQVPDNFETEDEQIKDWIQKRKEAKGKQYAYYNHLVSTAVGKEFVEKLANETDMLSKHKRQVIKDSIKHKKKSNGYEADHMKFQSTEDPEYTFELQVKSRYVKEIAKKGSAAHDKRPGKSRKFPDVEEKDFVQKLKKILPRYKELRKEKGEYTLYTYHTMENCMKYFENKLQQGSEKYYRAKEKVEQQEREVG